jgi:hypothetical protein
MGANDPATYASVDHAGVMPVESTDASAASAAVETTGR